jgi:polyvinyl alcohol dehydrogenase (cytochrome)
MPIRLVVTVACLFAAASPAAGQANPVALYAARCAACHDGGESRAPDRETLRLKSAEAVRAVLADGGSMATHARGLTEGEREVLVEYLAAKTPSRAGSGKTAACASPARDDRPVAPPWSGWGVDPYNTRFQKYPGIRAEDVPHLKLKWAFGLPGVTSAYGQPAVSAGRVYLGSATGVVYALDADTGCVHWTHIAPAGVRTAISLGPRAGSAGMAVYFGDIRGSVHAIDAATGAWLWTTTLDTHHAARITGAPTLFGDYLYVPVSSGEVVAAGRATYECCTFRGSVVALDSRTGAVKWRTHTIAQTPRPLGAGASHNRIGPAGAPVWASPTIDAARGVLYVGTGNAYSEPVTDTSDAIIAMDLATGAIRWTKQVTPNDVFVSNCRGTGNPNCPETLGPDFDFGSSPILRQASDGRSVLIVGQKSGVVYGLDPDAKGTILWQFRAGRGSTLGGIQWGMAADEQNVYVPVSDRLEPPSAPRGLFALQFATGSRLWHTPTPAAPCEESRRTCLGALSAAVTAIPGVVFAGAVDGYLRAYSADDGRVLWSYDTAREFETVNGVEASGGSLDSAGPVVAGGMLFVGSGYGLWRSQPGNVLLAFQVQR